MNLNATFIAQLVVFFVLAWVTMTYVWPPIMKALDERAAKMRVIKGHTVLWAKVDE